jgi:hypothetical protein
MIRPFVAVTLCVFLTGWSYSPSLLAGQAEEPETKSASPAPEVEDAKSVNPDEKSVKVPSKYGRLPRYYGKLDLSDEQRTKVYAVQEEFGKQIDDLLRQLDALKSAREKKVKAILTASQKRMLTTHENAALAARAKPKE